MIDRDRLRRALRRDRVDLRVRLGAHAVGVVRSRRQDGAWAVRAYVAPGVGPLPATITLTDADGAFEVDVVRHETPPMGEEPT